jgi:hypothetical protein
LKPIVAIRNDVANSARHCEAHKTLFENLMKQLCRGNLRIEIYSKTMCEIATSPQILSKVEIYYGDSQ